MKKLKIHDELVTDGIIRIFERESLIVKSMKEIKYFIAKIVLIGLIYSIVLFYIQRYVIFSTIFIAITTLLVSIYVFQGIGKICYLNSIRLGGTTKDLFKNKTKWKLYNCTTYNWHLMKKEDMKMLKKALKVNGIINIECIKEIRNCFLDKKKKETFEIWKFIKDTLSDFLVPITISIVATYTILAHNLDIGENVINIAYIIFTSIIVFAIIVLLYIIFKIRNFSILDSYIYPRLASLLTELIIRRTKSKKV